jgi:hypothetical protein
MCVRNYLYLQNLKKEDCFRKSNSREYSSIIKIDKYWTKNGVDGMNLFSVGWRRSWQKVISVLISIKAGNFLTNKIN